MRMDTEQFEQVVIEHRRMVFSLALHVLRDRSLAEEITQDVFLALFQHAARIESEAHLLHWLRRVAARRCIDQLRRRRLRRWLLLDAIDEPAAEVAALPRRDPLLAARLDRLLRALPPLARVALVLRYQQDLDPAEIGRVLGITEYAVRQKLRHALTHLKLRLAPPPASGPRQPQTRPGAGAQPKPEGNLHACVSARPEVVPANLEHSC